MKSNPTPEAVALVDEFADVRGKRLDIMQRVGKMHTSRIARVLAVIDGLSRADLDRVLIYAEALMAWDSEVTLRSDDAT